VQETPREYPNYEIRDGKLYRHILLPRFQGNKGNPVEGQWKECVAKGHCPEILRANHDGATTGHLGIAKTIACIAYHYYWPEMFHEIARYVRARKICLRHKVAQTRSAGTLHATTVHLLWEHVMLDLVGPFPRFKKGYTS